jgi:orotate phosphoribosyltransferase
VEVDLNGERVLEMLKLSDAYLEGHFRYTSGRHGSVYFEKIRIAQRPDLVCELGTMMAGTFADLAGEIDVVCSPAFGAIVFGFATALSMVKPFAFIQRGPDEKMTVRSGFTMLGQGSRVLLVEDVVTTGGSLLESASALEERGAVVTAAGILVDRTAGRLEAPFPCRSLLSIQAESWPADDCPLCRSGMPVMVPGSSGRKQGPA